MEAKLMGMLWMTPAGWRRSLLEGTWRTPKAPPVGHPRERMNIYTLLAGPPGNFRDAPAREWGGEIGRRQRLAGVHHAGGASRHLFGAGDGPAEAVAEAKQNRSMLVAEWISEDERRRAAETRPSGEEFLLLSWVNPSRSICNTICNSRAPFGYGWASVALRPAYGV